MSAVPPLPSPVELRWAWQLVGVHSGVVQTRELPASPPCRAATTARASSVLIACLARRLAADQPPNAWATDLVGWMIRDVGGVVDPRSRIHHGIPLATGVLLASILGQDMPGWIDRHGSATDRDLPAFLNVCWAVAYTLDAVHQRPGLADWTVRDLIAPAP